MSAVETTVTPPIDTTVLAQLPELQELDRASQSLEIDARGIQIHSPEGYTFAADKLADIKGRVKRLEALRRSFTAPLDLSKKAIMEFFAVPIDRLLGAEAGFKRAILAYQQEEAARVRKEQAKLEEKARKEREALQAKAEKAAAEGREEKAAELAVRAQTVVAPVAQPAIVKPAGVSVRKNWKARVVKPELVPREYLMVDESKLDKIAKALKQDAVVPGVEFYAEDILSSGSR